MFEFLSKLFGGFEGSKNRAKERLRLVLVHDRASLSPGLVEALKEELIEVITKYMEIDEEGLEVNFDKSDDSVALIANIPVKSVKRGMGEAPGGKRQSKGRGQQGGKKR
ncbi:MAG: cell division topological specificity factor MinE [Limnochordia bacterium]|jgi:cell division topological specificity factor|nr:cell division topological specificity factor MinE [Limnochordia bacterium]MDI9465805.1 cell division topological specificity factor MinE [Bacillota bacterium]NLO94669.1 cell division topological specificity factor MinE [Bacillota bacterium]HOB39963.1 cell division topological specificity factor MinE [Limnochordia bacterium]HOK30978.1 cell division topological specificity factor MinE [Limnochordia bacterium]